MPCYCCVGQQANQCQDKVTRILANISCTTNNNRQELDPMFAKIHRIPCNSTTYGSFHGHRLTRGSLKCDKYYCFVSVAACCFIMDLFAPRVICLIRLTSLLLCARLQISLMPAFHLIPTIYTTSFIIMATFCLDTW